MPALRPRPRMSRASSAAWDSARCCRRCGRWLKAMIDDVITVSLAEVAAAIKVMVEHNRVVAEGAGAVSVAAALSGRYAESQGLRRRLGRQSRQLGARGDSRREGPPTDPVHRRPAPAGRGKRAPRLQDKIHRRRSAPARARRRSTRCARSPCRGPWSPAPRTATSTRQSASTGNQGMRTGRSAARCRRRKLKWLSRMSDPNDHRIEQSHAE